MKVLILHPDPKTIGGIQLYYKKLIYKFTVPVGHCLLGRRADEKTLLSKVCRIVSDYGRFIIMLKKDHYEIVHVNPSLDFKMFLREGIFHLLAKMAKKKTVVFFRGWQKSFESSIQRYGLWLFKILYGKANVFIVLAEEFKNVLEAWGCTQPIYREVTVIDDDDLQGFDIHETIEKRQRSECWRILFLARIVREKGIYETIDAVSTLRTKHTKIELIIAGDGDELANVKSFVRSRSIANVLFTGYVRGEEKNRLLKSAHIFCLPTYSEGLPNAILESMAFGLPVVTRPVGGIADFFKNGEHGFATNSKQPTVFANFLEKLYMDKELYRKISLYNYQYAQSNFRASQAALRLEKIYESVLMNR